MKVFICSSNTVLEQNMNEADHDLGATIQHNMLTEGDAFIVFGNFKQTNFKQTLKELKGETLQPGPKTFRLVRLYSLKIN